MTLIFQMERELVGTLIDAIILRAAAMCRLEGQPMSVSSLSAYVNLPGRKPENSGNNRKSLTYQPEVREQPD